MRCSKETVRGETMRIYEVVIESKDGREWASNYRDVHVAANSFDELLPKVWLKKNERIQEVKILAETD